MNCIEVKDIIQLYMDSEMDARDTLEVQRHLDMCLPCSSLLNAFIEQDQALRQTALSETADNSVLRDSILAAIRRESPQTKTPRLSPAALRRVAAVLILAIVTALILIFGRSLIVNQEVYAAVAADHAAHCTLDQLDKIKAIKERETLDKLVAEYGRMVPDLSAFGFGDPRAKACLVNGAKFLHLIFLDSQGQGLSLFIKPHASGLNAEKLMVIQKEGFEVASLSQSGIDLLVVSSLDGKQTASIARAVAEQLR